MTATAVLAERHRWIERFRVRVSGGPDSGLTCESAGVELAVGTGEGNHLRLTDPSVSRHHCAFAVTPHGIELRDLGSTNFTRLAGYRIERCYVTPGARIGIGKTTLVIEAMEEEYCEARSASESFGAMLGQSDAMRRVFAIAEKVSRSDAAVLIEGETGSGKGLLAEVIHEASPRAHQPFVVVDCGAIPANLIESHLFGHESGAFTGATRRRIGLFETAAGGTVFLDEVGELPLELQPKLLRVLENRQIYRVGSEQPTPVDFRLVAATNQDLRLNVNRGAFRSDLLYRLNTVRIVMPPLRDRLDDVPLLAHHFVRAFSGDPTAEASPQLIEVLLQTAWRGNVRELRNAVERLLVIGDDLVDQADDPEPVATTMFYGRAFDGSTAFQAAKTRMVADWERRYLVELLDSTGGNQSAAARVAKMDRSYLRHLLRRHDLIRSGADD